MLERLKNNWIVVLLLVVLGCFAIANTYNQYKVGSLKDEIFDIRADSLKMALDYEKKENVALRLRETYLRGRIDSIGSIIETHPEQLQDTIIKYDEIYDSISNLSTDQLISYFTANISSQDTLAHGLCDSLDH